MRSPSILFRALSLSHLPKASGPPYLGLQLLQVVLHLDQVGRQPAAPLEECLLGLRGAAKAQQQHAALGFQLEVLFTVYLCRHQQPFHRLRHRATSPARLGRRRAALVRAVLLGPPGPAPRLDGRWGSRAHQGPARRNGRAAWAAKAASACWFRQ